MHDDWGERAPRWRGIRSEVVDVQGTPAHLVRVDGPADGIFQLLVHGLGGAATNWLEVARPLAAFGPVVAPDLPGFGRTPPRHSRASRIRANVGFLRALLRNLDVAEVVVHANSMGGLLGTFLAAAAPGQVRRLILLDPALPGPRRSLHRLGRRTLATFAPFVVPRAGRLLLGRMYATRTADQLWEANQSFIHGDASRLSPELAEVSLDNIRYGTATPWRLECLAAAAESVVDLQLATRPVWRAVAAVRAPTLLLWGDRDQLIGRSVIDRLQVRRPDWELHVFAGVGHAAQMEVPDDYLEVVGGWLSRPVGGDPPVPAPGSEVPG